MRPQAYNWEVCYVSGGCNLCGSSLHGDVSWRESDSTFVVCALCSDALGWPYPEFEDDEDDEDDYDGYCEDCGQAYFDCDCDDEDENDPQRELGGE